MQDRYAGDIGDFVKYSLLNCLSAGRTLGVAWYRFPNEGHNADGKHIGYLDDPARWRGRDPRVFDAMQEIVRSGERSIAAVERSACLNAAAYAGEELFSDAPAFNARANWREGWFRRVQDQMRNCDIVFADPDNGLCSDETFRAGNRKIWKRISVGEVAKLAHGRTAVIYHHNSRRKGGHEAEIQHWTKAIGAAFAVRARYASSRTFFVVHPDEGTVERVADWCRQFCKEKVELFR